MIETRHIELDPETDDNPDVQACLAVWHEQRGDDRYPAWSKFDWFRFPATLLPYFVVVDVIDGGADFHYRFWGTSHTTIFHQDYTNHSVRALEPPEVARGMAEQYERVLANGTPSLFLFEIQDGMKNDLPFREISLRLPYSDGGTSITQIVSLSDNRRQAEEFSEFFAAQHEAD